MNMLHAPGAKWLRWRTWLQVHVPTWYGMAWHGLVWYCMVLYGTSMRQPSS